MTGLPAITFDAELVAAFEWLGVAAPPDDPVPAGGLEQLRRLAADQLGLPTVPFWFADSVVNPLVPAGVRSVVFRSSARDRVRRISGALRGRQESQ